MVITSADVRAIIPTTSGIHDGGSIFVSRYRRSLRQNVDRQGNPLPLVLDPDLVQQGFSIPFDMSKNDCLFRSNVWMDLEQGVLNLSIYNQITPELASRGGLFIDDICVLFCWLCDAAVTAGIGDAEWLEAAKTIVMVSNCLHDNRAFRMHGFSESPAEAEARLAYNVSKKEFEDALTRLSAMPAMPSHALTSIMPPVPSMVANKIAFPFAFDLESMPNVTMDQSTGLLKIRIASHENPNGFQLKDFVPLIITLLNSQIGSVVTDPIPFDPSNFAHYKMASRDLFLTLGMKVATKSRWDEIYSVYDLYMSNFMEGFKNKIVNVLVQLLSRPNNQFTPGTNEEKGYSVTSYVDVIDKIHSLIGDVMQHRHTGSKPYFLILYGPPASGKSRAKELIIQECGLGSNQFVIRVNLDEIITTHQTYAKLLGQMHKHSFDGVNTIGDFDSNETVKRFCAAYAQVRAQVSFIGDTLMNIAREIGASVVIETTGGSIGWFLEQFPSYVGYEFYMAYPIVEEVSDLFDRVVTRGKIEGRFVQQQAVTWCHGVARQKFLDVVIPSADMFTRVIAYDSSNLTQELKLSDRMLLDITEGKVTMNARYGQFLG
jgi:hypothetical protein